MPRLALLRALLSIVLVAAALAAEPLQPVSQAHAQTVKLGPSGLPLPRFVSLKSSRVNMRVGPGTSYRVEWQYRKAGLPMEIIQEYDNWRRVRDADGAEGWINQALLSGRRTGLVAPWSKGEQSTAIPLLAEPDEDARVVARVQSGVLGEIEKCDGAWCRMRLGGHEGWIVQASIWGVYPEETVEE